MNNFGVLLSLRIIHVIFIILTDVFLPYLNGISDDKYPNKQFLAKNK